MKIHLWLLFLLLAPFSSAQFKPITKPVEPTLDQLIEVRTKLIDWYVLSSSHYAWGVSVCGGEDLLSGREHSWLTIYVYSDSVGAFAKDFDKAATRSMPNGPLGIDGVTVMVEIIKRPKHGN
jgi:hypothetical protein